MRLLRVALLSLSCKATNLADGGMWGRGADAYCHDNVTNVQQKQSTVNLVIIFFNVCPVLHSCSFMTSANISNNLNLSHLSGEAVITPRYLYTCVFTFLGVFSPSHHLAAHTLLLLHSEWYQEHPYLHSSDGSLSLNVKVYQTQVFNPKMT